MSAEKSHVSNEFQMNEYLNHTLIWYNWMLLKLTPLWTTEKQPFHFLYRRIFHPLFALNRTINGPDVLIRQRNHPGKPRRRNEAVLLGLRHERDRRARTS